MTTHTIRRGFDVRLSGRPELALVDANEPQLVAVETAEFPGIKPKVLVKEGARVTTGQPLFLDKRDRKTVWCSPATGTVEKVELGARRFLVRVVIRVEGKEEFFATPKAPKNATREQMVDALQSAGLWPLLLQRPLGKMPTQDIEPVAIFVNGREHGHARVCCVHACARVGLRTLRLLCACLCVQSCARACLCTRACVRACMCVSVRACV